MTTNEPASALPASMFDGLEAAVPEGMEAARLLRDAGFVRSEEMASYPAETWCRCIEAVRTVAYPQQSADVGLRLLGRAFTNHYLGTLVGRVIRRTLPLLGPEQIVARLPGWLALGRGKRERGTVEMIADREWVVRVPGVASPPEFLAGMVEAALEGARVEPQVEATLASPTAVVLHVRWRRREIALPAAT